MDTTSKFAHTGRQSADYQTMHTVCFANIPYNIDRRLSEMALKSIASFSRLAPSDCPSLEEQLRAWVA